jgi:penicillin amidase
LAPRLSKSGSALIANDPHLGVSLPNIWLVAGYRCPSYHVVGLMIPGLPFVALGRNPQIAWGGTNLHAQSSDLFDVSHLSNDDPRIRHEPQTIRVRFWRDRAVTLRHTPWGPLVSDSPLFGNARPGEKIAMRWVGDQPSHEITAMLRANRARSVEEFAEAFEEYAVSGQNFLVADRQGKIGHVIAARMPKRDTASPRPYVLDPAIHEGEWLSFWSPADFPFRTDPAEGFLASANNRPPDSFPPVGEMFPPTDRVDRIAELLRAGAPWDCAKLTELQRDTYSRSSVQLRDLFVLRLNRLRAPAWKGWLDELVAWDGTYRRDSRGAVVFQTLLWHYIRQAYRERYGKRLTHFLLGSELSRLFAIEDLSGAEPRAQALLESAAERTSKTWRRRRRWGDLHRLRLGHFFQTIPAFGKKFRFHDLPAEGSTETVQKTAHSVTPRRHAVHYGSQARHISDLADPDANFFLLLGGQDGWLGSDTFDDQVPRWDRAELITVPLQIETVRRLFPTEMILEPEKKLGA